LPSEPSLGIPDLAVERANDFAAPGDVPSATPRRGSPGLGTDASPVVRADGFRVLSVVPALLNEQTVRQALERNYPPLLRDAGIGGIVVVWILLDEQGRVVQAELKESSGHRGLDDAALEVAPTMRFSPAMNRDQRVKVWVSVPVRFLAQ
jgi:protein TonB